MRDESSRIPVETNLDLKNNPEKPESEREKNIRELRRSLALWTEALQKGHELKLTLPENVLLVKTTDRGQPFSGGLDAIGIDFIVEVGSGEEIQLGLVDTTGTGYHGGMRGGIYPFSVEGNVMRVVANDPWTSNGIPVEKLAWGSVDAMGAPASEGVDVFEISENEKGTYGPYSLTHTAGPDAKRELEIELFNLSDLTDDQLRQFNERFTRTGVPDAIMRRKETEQAEEKRNNSFEQRLRRKLMKLYYSIKKQT